MREVLAAVLICAAQWLLGAQRAEVEVLFPSGEVPLSTGGGARVARGPDGMLDLSVDRAEPGKWPALYLDFPTPRNLSDVSALKVTVTNRSARMLHVGLKVKGDTLQGRLPAHGFELAARREKVMTLRFFAEKWVFDKPHGLVGLKRPPYVGDGSSYSLEKVRSISIYQPPDVHDTSIGIRRIELVRGTDTFERPTVLKADTFCPWVDEFGQARFAEWPDKVHSVEELRARGADEERQFKERPDGIPESDRFGGWAGGPQLKATGFFRTEKINGKWWFVDPEGRLFFAHGADYGWEQIPTGITKREHYFEKLPPETGVFAQFWGYHGKPAPANHNFYSKPENVPFKTFVFSSYNLYLKYGENWGSRNRETTGRRMRSWGLNLIASPDVGKEVRRPYVVGIAPHSRLIEGVNGYWGKLLDPFAPEFAENCRKRAEARRMFGTNEYCIGWFAHNELSWGTDGATLARNVMSSPEDQPAKVALLGMLEAKGVALDKATDEDYRQLGEALADRYYSTVRAAIKAVAPNHLYLGDRNDKENLEVFRAASRYVDVITVNDYEYRPTRALPGGSQDRPFLVTEFHFGCYDTGYFYASLLPVKDQATRADCYRRYLRAALDDPNYIGTCWFTWRDCPITGDWNEAANAQVGLVSIQDVPYTEMVRAMREIAAEMYPRRWHGRKRE